MATKKAVKQTSAPRLSAEDKKWMARDDLRTIQQAQSIAADPKRMKAAQQEAEAQVKALQGIAKK